MSEYAFVVIEDPNSPEQGLQWSRLQEYFIDIVEVGEVGVYFQHPIWLYQYHGPNV